MTEPAHENTAISNTDDDIVIAILGTVLGVPLDRRARFLRIATEHRSRIVGEVGYMSMGLTAWVDKDGNVISSRQVKLDEWHTMMVMKYLEAAKCPWLPVEPDPPPPE